jgi:formylglycine-generating enzyme required for sulfatase activity
MTYDLFISHSSEDSETALALVTDFENRNITCWMAPRDIPIGSSYHEEIVHAIENSRAMLLLFSGNANKSAHVLREVELAEQGRKHILPLRIDLSEPVRGLKYMLANKQWVERTALGNRLVDHIQQRLASTGPIRTDVDEARARPAPAPPKKKSAVTPMLIGAVAVLVLLLGGGIAAWQGGWLASGPPHKQVAAKEEPAKTEPAKTEPAKPVQPQTPSSKAQEPPPQQPEHKQADDKKGQPVREARVEPASLPIQPQVEIDIQKEAPSVGIVRPGKTFFRECDLCPVMAVVPGGSNLIGSPAEENGRSGNEGPQQAVDFRMPFAVGRSEVSFEEYLACSAEGGCTPDEPGHHGWGYGKQPAMNLSWHDAKRYVEWLSQKTRARYRLLSEAEWEYVARGCARVCDSTPFWFGNQISRDRANYDWRYAYLGSPKAQARRKTVPIDEGESNPFGLLHVHGNVREWVEDCWNESLAGLPRDGTPRTSGDATGGSCGAAPGTTNPGTSAPPGGMPMCPPKGRRNSASASPANSSPRRSAAVNSGNEKLVEEATQRHIAALSFNQKFWRGVVHLAGGVLS